MYMKLLIFLLDNSNFSLPLCATWHAIKFSPVDFLKPYGILLFIVIILLSSEASQLSNQTREYNYVSIPADALLRHLYEVCVHLHVHLM